MYCTVWGDWNNCWNEINDRDRVDSSTFDTITRKSKSTTNDDFEFRLCYALLCSRRWYTYTYVFKWKSRVVWCNVVFTFACSPGKVVVGGWCSSLLRSFVLWWVGDLGDYCFRFLSTSVCLEKHTHPLTEVPYRLWSRLFCGKNILNWAQAFYLFKFVFSIAHRTQRNTHTTGIDHWHSLAHLRHIQHLLLIRLI